MIIVILFVLLGGVRALNGWNDLFTLLCLMFPFIYLASWYAQLRRVAKVAKGLRDPHIVVIVDDSGLTFRAIDRTSSTAWAGFKEVWQYPDLWLLFPYGPSSAFTSVPTAALPPETWALIASKLKEHGAKIVA